MKFCKMCVKNGEMQITISADEYDKAVTEALDTVRRFWFVGYEKEMDEHIDWVTDAICETFSNLGIVSD